MDLPAPRLPGCPGPRVGVGASGCACGGGLAGGGDLVAGLASSAQPVVGGVIGDAVWVVGLGGAAGAHAVDLDLAHVSGGGQARGALTPVRHAVVGLVVWFG